MTDVPMTDDQPQDDAPSLEARLARLEEILARMESEDVALEEALTLFEEGVTHVREAEKVLAETELRVEELLASGRTRPMGEEDESP
jgi:exodeoxyribonuclease VII small subunit